MANTDSFRQLIFVEHGQAQCQVVGMEQTQAPSWVRKVR